MVIEKRSKVRCLHSHIVLVASTLLVVTPLTLQAQTNPPPSETVETSRVSGVHTNPTASFSVVYETDIELDETVGWLRLHFADAHLDGDSFIRIISALDGRVQRLDAAQLRLWRRSTAYFNGHGVSLELVAGPRTDDNYFVLGSITVGFMPPGTESLTQCGPEDNRVLSDNPAVGRTLPSGCTASMYNAASCLITAGHCLDGNNVMEFNVPPSQNNGTIQHPDPQDQYAIDLNSRIGVANGIGDDWGHFLCFENSETGLLPFEAQGAMIPLAPTIPDVVATVRVTGYGVDTGPANQAQQESTGPVTGLAGTAIDHQADTQGGSSGSPIVDVATGMTVAIHTHGGCNAAGTNSNHGTLITTSGLQAAVTECVGIEFDFPNGLVDLVDPANGSTLLVGITSTVDAPDPNTVMLEVSVDGSPFSAIPMTDMGNGFFEATIPPAGCGSTIRYFLSLETFGGVVVVEPSGAPDVSYDAFGGIGFDLLFEDDFESPVGYTTSGDAVTGHWEAGVPVDCDRGDPPTDFDGSGSCFLTDNNPSQCNSDVDDGFVILTTPAFDLLGDGVPFVRYARWFSNGFGNDVFTVDISNDNGATWINLETVGPEGLDAGGDWFTVEFNIRDFVEPTAQVRLRFTTSDTGGLDIVEAAIDALRFDRLVCDSVDVTPPTVVHDGGITTDPYTGYIDPKAESSDGQTLDLGIDTFRIRFSEPVQAVGGGILTPASFTVTGTGPTVPTVVAVDAADNPWITLTLSGPIPLQEWTTLAAHVEDLAGNVIVNLGNQGPDVDESDRIDVGFLPADVNQTGHVEPLDLLRFKQIVNGVMGNPQGEDVDFADLDRNGAINPLDLLVLKQLINGFGNATRSWTGESIPARP